MPANLNALPVKTVCCITVCVVMGDTGKQDVVVLCSSDDDIPGCAPGNAGLSADDRPFAAACASHGGCRAQSDAESALKTQIAFKTQKLVQASMGPLPAVVLP
jgi:hypothetical protein